MNANAPRDSRNRTAWFIVVGGLLLMLLALLLPRDGSSPRRTGEPTVVFHESTDVGGRANRAGPRHRLTPSAPAATAEEIVAGKVSRFAQSRREICLGLARKHQIEVPAEVERFFDAVEVGNWEELSALFESLQSQHHAKPPVPGVDAVWPVILDAYGAAQQAHLWPAQKLLDYGNAVLGALRPDMVYVGGTDPGRWIPALMSTSEGERHVVITQNGLADPKYLEYVQFQYGERFATLSQEEGIAAQKAYLEDAGRRLKHDQQFPDEPRQMRPGEDVRFSSAPLKSGFGDGGVQASGMTSVMAINETLLQALLAKNPNLSFALEESFPFKSINAEAAPLGPIMELRAQGEQDAFPPERATESVDYWRAQTRQLLADPAFTESDAARKSYSKLVSSQAGLLRENNYLAEAEQAYLFANELCPYSPEAVFRYVNLLVSQQRTEEAMRVADTAIQHDPKNQQFRDLAGELKKAKKN